MPLSLLNQAVKYKQLGVPLKEISVKATVQNSTQRSFSQCSVTSWGQTQLQLSQTAGLSSKQNQQHTHMIFVSSKAMHS